MHFYLAQCNTDISHMNKDPEYQEGLTILKMLLVSNKTNII